MKLKEIRVIKHMTVRIGDSYEFAKIGLEELYELDENDDPVVVRGKVTDIIDDYIAGEISKLEGEED